MPPARSWAKKGVPNTHPIHGDELRALRKLQREQEPKSPFVFTSERNSPFSTGGFARMMERAGVEAKLGFKAHPHMLRHACGFRWPTRATIRERCRLTSATATSSTRCDTPSCRRAGSRTSSDDTSTGQPQPLRQARRAAGQLAAAATTAPAIVGQTVVNPRHHLTFS